MADYSKVTISEGGRVVIPAAFRKNLDLKIGDELIIKLEDGEIKLYTRKQAIRKAQEEVERLRKEKNISFTVDDFLEFRKKDHRS
jgi:AbrB family looped-hinge helix DNA binding protein